MRTALLFAFAASALFTGCDTTPADWEDEDSVEYDVPMDDEYGKPVFDVAPEDTRSLGFEASGPLTSGLSSSTEVWKATKRWYEIDQTAGIAWPANSGKTWDEKFALWIDSLEKTTSDDGYMTVELTTPWGKKIASPSLECAEMGMFLRATFASWHSLPFFLTAYSSSLGYIHFGHFGVVDHNGKRLSGYPTFATSYKDYTGEMTGKANTWIVANWPDDTSLEAKYLTSAKDDAVEFLGDNAYFGAYADEVFLNKRVGHFMLRLLTNFGSMHLASPRNTFDIKPQAIAEGDLLIERWQRSGIGHVMVVKEVDTIAGGKLDAQILFGSMPRIQARWYDAAVSKSYFTDESTGGPEMSGDGVPYSQLGGGVKKWRTPITKNGRWMNIVPTKIRDQYIGDTDYAQIAARPATFQTLLGNMTPAQERDVAVERIEMQRDNLEIKPASCASRERREEAFDSLYAVMGTHFGQSKAQVDAEYRILADYVFAELVYDQAKTCCWNSTTAEMYEIVMDYNEELVEEAASNGQCAQPVVFKARGGNYDVFKTYAAQTGRAAQWKAWTEDETCPGKSVAEDKEKAHDWTAFCEIAEEITGVGGSSGGSTGGSTTGCGGLDWEGECSGNTVRWCENDTIQTYACGSGTSCGWNGGLGYYWCQ